MLSVAEEAIVAAFRQHTLLPLDDCLYALQPTIPHLSRSSLHRCLQRHGISRLPNMHGDKPEKRKFKTYPIGYFHIDIADVRTAQGKLYLLVAIERTSKFAFVELHEKLCAPLPRLPSSPLPMCYGIQFADLPRNREGWTARYRVHRFDQTCREHGIEHRLTKPNHPWTNGQVERMNRTIKDATLKRYHYDGHHQLRQHLQLFVDAYNHARRLKTLRGLTPYEYVAQIWTENPERFRINPYHNSTGLNT